jgi:hypothetical protein
VIDTPIATTVTNTDIYAGHDDNGALTIEHAELDSARWFLYARGNAAGSVVVSNAELFAASNGAFRSTSLSSIGLEFTHSLCQGCGFTGGDIITSPAIFWGFGSTGQTTDVRIESSNFTHLNIAGASLGGPVYITGARNTIISNNFFYNPDTTENAKAIAVGNARNIDISNNQLYWDRAYTALWGGSQAIETVNVLQIPNVHISGNNITNNSTTPLNCGICSGDSNTTNYSVVGNNFGGSGAILTQINTNILNKDQRNVVLSQDHVVKWGPSGPTVGSWKVGDIMYNIAPAIGRPMGWVCTASGTPGTWTALSNIP